MRRCCHRARGGSGIESVLDSLATGARWTRRWTLPAGRLGAASLRPVAGSRARSPGPDQPGARDGLALVLSSGLTSAVGLLYWVVAARLFAPATVGVNSVALSTMQLLGGVAHLNLTQALLRFGPVAGRQTRRLMLACYAVASDGGGAGRARVRGGHAVVGAGDGRRGRVRPAAGVLRRRHPGVGDLHDAGLPAHGAQARHGRAAGEPRLRPAEDGAARPRRWGCPTSFGIAVVVGGGDGPDRGRR